MKLRMTKLSFAVAQVMGVGVAMTVATGPAFAQQTAQRIEKIEVTGSNIKRIEGETALPVTVISREEIQRSGAQTAAELLTTISAASGGGYNLSQGVGDSGKIGRAHV